MINNTTEVDVLVLGAGLTGLTTASYLSRLGHSVHIVDIAPQAGGAMRTHYIEDFIIESGPNTGILSNVEIIGLIRDLGLSDSLQIANPSAKRRLILKGGRLHALPSGLISAIKTPLFTLSDKFRILGEPWRSKGNNTNESVADMVRRRLGHSFYDYAVNPFIGGIYAGNPETLITRHALPKLYALEQNYSSFIRGALALVRQPKTELEKEVTKDVFSFRGGFSTLINALVNDIGMSHIALGIEDIHLYLSDDNRWQCRYHNQEREQYIRAKCVVSALPAHALPNTLPFIRTDLLERITDINYSPVVQVVLGYRDARGLNFDAFGALMPSSEEQKLLGILNLSACFPDRVPKGGAVLSCFLGGSRAPSLVSSPEQELVDLCLARIKAYFDYTTKPDIVQIFRHPRAIPQYEISTESRLQAAQEVQTLYPTLILAGNSFDGVGIADRVKQARKIAQRVHDKIFA